MHKKLITGLVVLAVVRMFMVAGFLHGVPEIRYANGQFHQGGDQGSFYGIAQSFGALQPEKGKLPLGFSLLLVPVIKTLRPDGWQDLVRPMLLVHTALALGTVFLIGFMTRRLTGSTAAGLFASGLWVFHPYMMYGACGLLVHTEEMRTIYISHAMWFPMLSDPSSAFFVVLGLALFFAARERPGYVVPAGLALGMAALIRTPNALVPILCCVACLLQGQGRAGVKLGLAALCMYLPQLAYNMFCNGNPLAFGYTAETESYGGREALFSFGYLVEYVRFAFEKYTVAATGLAAIGLALLAGLLYYGRTKRCEWALMIMVTAAYGLIYGSWWAFKCFPYRFLIPVVPLVIIMATGLCCLAARWCVRGTGGGEGLT